MHAHSAMQVNGQEPSADGKDAAADKAEDDEPEAGAAEEEAKIVDPAQVRGIMCRSSVA